MGKGEEELRHLLFSMVLAAISVSACMADCGSVSGTFTVSGKEIPLKFAYAHFHDNAEKLLDRPRELRILLCDREIKPEQLRGIVFLPIEELARQGVLQGLIIELDPSDTTRSTVVELLKPTRPGQSLRTVTRTATPKGVFDDWKYDGKTVSGAITQNEPIGGNVEPDSAKVTYSLKFTALVLKEPAVTSDLKGAQALASPLIQLHKKKAEALIRCDFTSVKAMTTARGNGRAAEMFKMPPDQLKKIAKQAGTEMKQAAAKVERIVVRGDSAVIIFPGHMWSTYVKEAGVWKCDD